MIRNGSAASLLALGAVAAARAQDQNPMGRYQGAFYSPYEGTFFFAAPRLTDNTVLVFDPEIAGAPEYLWEGYYSAPVAKGFTVTVAARHYDNPAFNHDRGPVWAYSQRLHIEGGFRK